ncbi:MAG TPA: hypothetical protein P5567_08625 [Kiritimatiellia bacterium]|nr:hypothetical protein [Kiritimatiellia bacterium]HRZ12506.1 hypothetical protein [Kiritimatiellia bacterium]HSA17736.1 hypothetical protein [Kiritimatiellia bacterium]
MSTARSGRGTRGWIGPILAIVLIVAAGGAWWYFEKPAKPPDFGTLAGRWVRPDGGYVVEIKAVGKDGALEAAYFNPKPIHVAVARAFTEAGALNVFIELRDENYPGSTYTLAYDPAADQLQGLYYQAVMGQRFEVYFERIK